MEQMLYHTNATQMSLGAVLAAPSIRRGGKGTPREWRTRELNTLKQCHERTWNNFIAITFKYIGHKIHVILQENCITNQQNIVRSKE
jgi:hypothetical protein